MAMTPPSGGVFALRCKRRDVPARRGARGMAMRDLSIQLGIYE
jgi:hypothetical protein